MKIRKPENGDNETFGNPAQHPIRRYLVAALGIFFVGFCLFELVYIPLFGVHADGVPIPRWQMRPIDLFFHMLHSVSPALVEPIEAVLFCSAGAGIVGMYLGFRIISKKTVLVEPTRARIFNAIKGEPGIHFNELRHRTGINRGTLLYHLGILARTKKITCYKDGLFSRYLPEEWGISRKDMIVACRFRSRPDRFILTYLHSHPDATRHEIGSAAGISPSNVSWRIQRFLQEGIIRIDRGEGRTTRISLTSDAENSLMRLQCSPVSPDRAGSGPKGIIGQEM
ncbi:winged helix-turn-helix transcriptional regulator [Methanoregula sp.]|uniref:winged helix-turn-helix transcriptional regulator n=1 Tax=Methanoregula sp. TaxID=2052170 RepID=UPI003569F4B3